MSDITIIKRDGSLQEFRVQDIRRKIDEISIFIPKDKRDFILSEVESKLSVSIKGKVKSSDIQKALITTLAEFIDVDKPYMEFVTGRAVMQQIYHEMYKVLKVKIYETNINDFENYDKSAFLKYLDFCSKNNLITPMLLNYYSEEELKELSEYIDYSRDLRFKYIGILTLYKRYLMRYKAEVIELPQWRYMLIAMFVAINANNSVDKAKKYYDMVTKVNKINEIAFSPATPTLANGGKIRHQLSSCFVSVADDNLESIFDSFKEFAQYSKFGGGVGTDISAIRCEGSSLQGVHKLASGLLPPMKVFNDTAVYINQATNQRSGSICLTLQIWHPDIMDFLECRRNSGDERMRARDIFPAVSIPDLFMKRLKERGSWSLFDPYEYPELITLYGLEFEKRYLELEAEGKFIKQISCIELWTKIIQMQFETGMPFITFKDTMNNKNPHPELGMIRSSNLCQEIALPTKPNIYGKKITKINGEFEVYKFGEFVEKYGCKAEVITKFHNPLIESVETIIYETGETAVCNLGSINLLDYYLKSDNERTELIDNAVEFLDSIIDMNLYLTPQSEKSALKTRAIGLGIMNEAELCVYNKIMFGSEDHKKLIDELYADLSRRVKEASIKISDTNEPKNHYRMAIAPTGSISLIAGLTSGIDPIFKKRWVEQNILGSTPALVPNLNTDTWNYYVNAFEVDLFDLVELNAIRSKYVDQGISFTLYIDPDKVYENGMLSTSKVSKSIIKAWELGIKTIYYLRSRSTTMTKDVSADDQIINCEGCQ